MRPLRILTLAFLLFTLTAAAQTDRRIEEQKRVIAALEKRIATEVLSCIISMSRASSCPWS